MIVGYDLDGTLATQPPPNVKKWGLMNGEERRRRKSFLLEHYKNADRIMVPDEEEFYVISARRLEKPVLDITNLWLKKHFPNRVLGLHLLDESRSIEKVVKFKSGVIRDLCIKKFYEDNRKVLKGISRIVGDECELFVVENGVISRF